MTDTIQAAAATRFASTADRSRVMKLKWPIVHQERDINEVVLARLTAREVADFQEKLANLPEGARFVWPMFRELDGSPVGSEILDALDDDDRLALDKAALDFLPQRFRAVMSSGSGRLIGESIAPSSAA